MKTSKKDTLLRNVVGNGHNQSVSVESLKIMFRKNPIIRYVVFQKEQGKKSKTGHYQGYLELNKQLRFSSFRKQFPFSDIQPRKGTQQQAIAYCMKEETRLEGYGELGTPKKSLNRYNKQDSEIPKLLDDQRILLNHRLKDNYYKKFSDIEKDFELLYLKNKKWCKNLGDEYHPVQVLDVVPAKTIGIYGHSGIGKTTLTNKLLKEGNFSQEEISKKKASNLIRPKLGFNLTDESKKILGIEEIREDFPEFNDLIQIIDKGTFLETKGSHINNNFELIIMNSLHSPEYVYRSLPFGNQVEILRRLYLGNNSEVWKLVPHKKKHNRKIDMTSNLPKVLEYHFANKDLQLLEENKYSPKE